MHVGKVVGDKVQYRLDSPVAVGAFSTVYRCTELSSGRAYAMKVIEKKVAADNHMEEALIREVNALEVAGSSPYVTTLVDKMVSKHNYYLVMELAEGGTLLDLIREQRQELKALQASLSGRRSMSESLRSCTPPVMQYDRVQHFFKQLLLALSSLHNNAVVHRDVKPENILLNKRRTRLVLSDFGFACHAPPGTELRRACGTLRYCAPELLHENPRYDGRKVDVWAAGVTLYVMLFGGHPFRCPSQDPDTLLEVITTTRLRIPRPIPAEIEDMLQHMLCVNPAERWSVKQLLQHPWMTTLGPELCTPSVQSMSSARSFTSGATPVPNSAGSTLSSLSADAAGAVVELLSEDCPPLDAIPSDEEIVDDGFYQSSTDDKHSATASSSSPTKSATTTHLPTSTLLPDVPDGGVAAVLNAKEGETALTSSAGAAELPPVVVSASPAASERHEVLQQGSMSTSMVSIESSADSDDGRITAEESYTDEDDEAYRDDVANDVYTAQVRTAHRASSDACSIASTNNTYCDDEQLSCWWIRYSYGLYLTTRIVARFVGFFSLCVAAVAVRIILKRDLVDLPLPEVVRTYVAFLLSTPLRRTKPTRRQRQQQQQQQRQGVSHSPLSPLATTAKGPSLSSSSSPSAAASHASCSSKPAHEHAAPNRRKAHKGRHGNTSFIPGSSLRHYVRTADQMMRDSFVGNAVLEYNASLADTRPSLSLPSLASSEVSATSSPPAPSLATLAPSAPSVAQSLAMTEEARPSPPLTHASSDHVSDHVSDSIAPPVAEAADCSNIDDEERKLRCNSTAQLKQESAAAHHDAVALSGAAAAAAAAAEAKAGDTAIASTHDSPLISLATTESSPNPEAVVSSVKRLAPGFAAAQTGKQPDFRNGATDTTGDGDSGEEKLTSLTNSPQYMFSPISPLPYAFCGHRLCTEDFPLVNDKASGQ